MHVCILRLSSQSNEKRRMSAGFSQCIQYIVIQRNVYMYVWI